jgi:hypothetical protein
VTNGELLVSSYRSMSTGWWVTWSSVHLKHFCNTYVSIRSSTHNDLTHGGVGLVALTLRELLEALGLVAHGALDLDNLITRAWLTVDRLGAAALSLDLVPKVSELFGRVFGLRKVLVAAAALDLGGNGDALETARVSVNAWGRQ